MVIKSKSSADTPYSEVTPKQLYLNRRTFIAAAAAAAGTLALGKFGNDMMQPEIAEAGAKLQYKQSPLSTSGEKLTPLKDVTSYNNFYEFGTSKGDPAENAHTLKPRPWTVSVEGLVKKPQKLDIDSLMKLSPLEERIYRMRCVEGWSMVIPWIGFPLSTVLRAAEPLPGAKFVAFETSNDSRNFPNRGGVLDWPYVEGLRLDEANHPLAILAFGLYGETLPNQNGAPIRLVTPWKYGFKGIKSIVKIKVVKDMPPTTWNQMASNEYGFYSNVNPDVDHPRWSQATERRIGEFLKRKTLPFNGYADQVQGLYAGMDLKKNY